MKDTVTHSRVETFYEGRVTVDELKEFSDDRGFVSELWRTDDSQMNSPITEGYPANTSYNQKIKPLGQNSPQMCYFSHTNPLVMRGPHEHEDQTDWFITIKSKMVYMFVDEYQNVEWFLTDPKKIYRIKVEPGIIHSYRNVSLDSSAVTANFPSSLFMGVDKNDDVDEIRHEEKIEDNTNIYILGAGGRLGKSLVKKLFKNMKMHEYNVIPIYEKFDNSSEGMKSLNTFLDEILDEDVRTPNDIIVNCIARTNVQNDDDNFLFANFQLPKYITEFSIRHNFHLINFSTDYIYQKGDVGQYTDSKQKYEQWLEDFYNENALIGNNILSLQNYVHIVRLANLFSVDPSDTHNALNKLWNAYNNGPVCIPEGLVIMPTCVDDISEFLVNEYLFKLKNFDQFINVSSVPHTVEELFSDHFNVEDVQYSYVETPKVVNNPKAFLNRKCFVCLDSEKSINEKIEIIKNESS